MKRRKDKMGEGGRKKVNREREGERERARERERERERGKNFFDRKNLQILKELVYVRSWA